MPRGLLAGEGQGLIASTVEEIKAEDAEPDASGRKRKWYRLTPKGKRRLEQRVQAHRTWRGILDAFLPEDPLDSTTRSRG